ncbi:MAG: hypothetical protein IKZ57_05085 [Spirochaetia bacterium]|nr:hypothetical protein [Spirochaetia bacterium]
MKKLFLLFVLTFICIGSVCAADEFKDMKEAPALNVEGAYIIDLKPMRKKIEDNIAFLNMSELDEIKFDIYFVNYNTGAWVKNREKGQVKGYNDRDIVELNKTVKLKKVPFIAIIPDPAGDYDYKVYPKSHDVYIEIEEN